MSEWKPMHLAKEDGTLCQLRFRDPFGTYDVPGPYFLHEGQWYHYEPPMLVTVKPIAWREV